MKKIILFLILFSLQAHAGLPGVTDVQKSRTLSFDVKIGLLALVRQKNLQQNSSSFIFSTGSLNAGYISGRQKKSEITTLGSILKWDLKVKFRLNKNMNIIFTYN